MTMNQEGYPVFKGLQKPLEFMGIRGRFLTLAAAAIGVSFVGFIGFSIALGKIAGFIAMMVMALVELITIYIKQRGGLHSTRTLYPLRLSVPSCVTPFSLTNMNGSLPITVRSLSSAGPETSDARW